MKAIFFTAVLVLVVAASLADGRQVEDSSFGMSRRLLGQIGADVSKTAHDTGSAAAAVPHKAANAAATGATKTGNAVAHGITGSYNAVATAPKKAKNAVVTGTNNAAAGVNHALGH